MSGSIRNNTPLPGYQLPVTTAYVSNWEFFPFTVQNALKKYEAKAMEQEFV
jgi:hypothetical protein